MTRRTTRNIAVTLFGICLAILLLVAVTGCTGPIPRHDPFEPPQFEAPPQCDGPCVICDERGCRGDFDALRRLPGEGE